MSDSDDDMPIAALASIKSGYVSRQACMHV